MRRPNFFLHNIRQRKYSIFKASKPVDYKSNTLLPLLQATKNTSV